MSGMIIPTSDANKNDRAEESGGGINSDAKVEKVAPITIKKIKRRKHKNDCAMYEIMDNVSSSKQPKMRADAIISTEEIKDNLSRETDVNLQIQSTESGVNNKVRPSILTTKISNEEYTLYTCLDCGKMYIDEKEAIDHLCKDKVY